jgi:hypothetical protein
MNRAPLFDESLLGIQVSKKDTGLWQSIVDIFEEGDYKKTILGVFDYIDNSLAKKYGNADQSEFVFPHSKSKVHVSIKKDKFTVRARFLRLPQKAAVPILRQISEINFYPLVLSQIVLEGDELVFKYENPLELCDPYKVYGVLDEICINMDYYDDIFMEKFGATRSEETKIKKFSEKESEKAWENFQEYLREAEDYMHYFEVKRFSNFEWIIIALVFMKIDYYLVPQGFLRSEIEKVVSDLNNQNIPFNEALNKGKAAITKFKNLDKGKFEESCYIPEVFMPAKKRCDLACVQNMLKRDYENAKIEMANLDFMGATLHLLFGIYNLYFRNQIPADITKKLNKALQKTSSEPWEKAAHELWNATTGIMEMKDS